MVFWAEFYDGSICGLSGKMFGASSRVPGIIYGVKAPCLFSKHRTGQIAALGGDLYEEGSMQHNQGYFGILLCDGSGI